jgi:hypothetical protein
MSNAISFASCSLTNDICLRAIREIINIAIYFVYKIFLFISYFNKGQLDKLALPTDRVQLDIVLLFNDHCDVIGAVVGHPLHWRDFSHAIWIEYGVPDGNVALFARVTTFRANLLKLVTSFLVTVKS